MISVIITKILFLIAVIDPLGSIPVYLEATKHFDENHKKKIAIRAAFVAFLILLFFIMVGQIILEGMHVSLNAFQLHPFLPILYYRNTPLFPAPSQVQVDKPALSEAEVLFGASCYFYMAFVPASPPSFKME